MDLKILAKKDSQWRSIALKICKDKELADEIVQEMYIKMHSVKKEVNEFYIIAVIRNLFLDYCRKKKYNSEIKDLPTDDVFEPTDQEQEILNACSKLEFYEIELLDMNGEHSLRDLEKRYKINYQTINRIVAKAKVKIWEEVNKNEVLVTR